MVSNVLAPLRPFSEKYAEMLAMKKKYSLIMASILERFRMIGVKADRVKASEQAAITRRKTGKARALAKIGMNKNTAWHKARANNSLAFKDMTTTKIG